MKKDLKEKVLMPENLIFSILLMLWIISFAVVVTLNFRPLYYFDVDYLDIPAVSGFDEELIRRNYDVLIDYNSMFFQGELEFPDLPMSESGRIHFQEVKTIFVGLQRFLIADSLICAALLIRRIRRKSYAFLQLTGIVTIVIPVILGGLIALNWNWVFVAFHHIVFNNDYWIFDKVTDPVIMMLPDTFFMHCALMILVLVVLGAAACLAAGCVLTGKNTCRKNTPCREREAR
ncbi:MAG: TIGR01906 family membrane protein [Lachnospiraceae bacterium]|nr:TIGR01906 family membrane protein [Lachnospiraceae bacterium]